MGPRKRGLLAASILVATGGVSAVAAPPAVNWQGFYVGGHIGGATSSNRWDAPDGGPFIYGLIGTFGQEYVSDGSVIGGQAGYNFQVNSFVFGVQGDFASAVTQGDSVCNAPLPSPPFQGPGAMTRCWTETEWLASATARAGVTWDRALIYIKGGAAWLSSVYELGRGEWFAYSVEPHFRKRETRAGWTIGAGIEYALSPRVSGFIEYNYYDFGTRTIDLPMVQFPDIIQPMAIRQDMQVVKVGLNSRFGGGEQAKPTIPVKAAARDSLRLHNWTGFYAGGHVGHGWSEREALPNFTNVRDNFSSQTFSSGVTSGGVDYLLQTDYLENFQGLRGRHHGWFGGVQGGYSYQFNSGVVAGVVGDFSFRGVEASSSGGWVQSTTDFYNYYTDATYTTLIGSELINNSLGGSLNLNARLDYFGTLRGRLGFAWGQFLPYVTGGLAWGENSVTAFGRIDDITATITFDSNGAETGRSLVTNYSSRVNSTQSKLHVGWTAGGGVEYAINDRWSFATEYLYVDLGYKNYVVNFSGGEVMNVSLGQKFNSVRAVLNYRI